MSSVTEGNLGLNYGWAYGESGWNTGMDDNLVKLGFTSRNQVKGILSAPPSTPSNGDAYIVGTSPTGLFSGNFGKVAIWDRTVWLFLTPKNHEVVYNIANGCDYKYDNGWVLKQEDELSPYVKVKDFTFSTGYTVTDQKQCLLNLADNKYYQWFGSLPKVVAAGATPATSGGIGAGGWVDRNSDTLRTDLAAVTGADLIPTLQSVYCATGLDTTGSTNESSSIAALLAKYDAVKLPKTGSGFIRADITVPTGKTLLGSGAPVFNASTLKWSTNGTLVKGTISTTNSKFWSVGNISVDAYDLGNNGLQGLSDTTAFGFVKNVNTRANNHGQLWEQNSSSNSGSNGGNIVVEDCKHYQGPNGFVSKMPSVSFIRCKTYDVAAQSFVVVSDNVNGQGIFSRASNTLFEDCEANGTNNISLHVYSRNYHDGVDTVNPTYLTKWVRGNFGAASARHVQIGDNTVSGFVAVLNDDVIIDNGVFIGSTYESIILTYANRFKLTGVPLFGNNGGGNIVFGDSVFEPSIPSDMSYANAPNAAGVDLRYKIVTNNLTTLTLSERPEIVEFKNTVSTVVATVKGLISVYYCKSLFKISDNFTECTFTGVSHKGNGTAFYAYFNGTSWVDLGEITQPGELSLAGGLATVTLNMAARRKAYKVDQNGVSITSVVLSGAENIPAGDSVVVRIRNSNASSITIAGWDANLKFADGLTAPTALAALKKLILNLYSLGGGVFVVTSFQTHT